MTDQNFSAQDSLRLIHSMIDKAKEKVSDNSFFLLLWGWLVFIAALAQYILLVFVEWPYHYQHKVDYDCSILVEEYKSIILLFVFYSIFYQLQLTTILCILFIDFKIYYRNLGR